MTDLEKLDLARRINATERLLHRQRIRSIFANVGHDFLPAMTPPQCHLVMTVREHGSMTIKRLTQVLFVKAPAVSMMVDRLVEMGILTREENPADRREVLVRVSVSEESKIQEMERRHLQFIIDLCDKVGPDYARMWGDLYARLDQALSEDGAEPIGDMK